MPVLIAENRLTPAIGAEIRRRRKAFDAAFGVVGRADVDDAGNGV